MGALKLRAIDLAVGNLFGSNLFNILILAIDGRPQPYGDKGHGNPGGDHDRARNRVAKDGLPKSDRAVGGYPGTTD